MKLQCLIVDDEPPAHVILERYIQKIERLQLLGNCYNALEALNFLHQHTVDVLFLDIDMPEFSGLELLATLPNLPAVVLTTAHSEFALQGYDYGVVDYLLKPIRFERFLKAVNRIVFPLHRFPEPNFPALSESEPSYLMVKVDSAKQKINTKDIAYLSAAGNFIKVHLLDKRPLLVTATLGDMQQQLANFLRIHKSYLINVAFLEKIEGNRLWLYDGIELPIGGSYKQAVLDRLK